MSPPRPMTRSWAGTRACSRASSRISPRSAPASGRSTSGAARARSPASSWRASGPAPWRRSIRPRRSSRRPGSDTRASTSARRPRSGCRSVTACFDASARPARRPLHARIPWRDSRRCVAATRPGGVVAACVWDHAGRQGPLRLFWDAARVAGPGRRRRVAPARDARGPPRGAVRGRGPPRRDGVELAIRVEHPTFDEWWEPFTRGVGPAGRLPRARGPPPVGPRSARPRGGWRRPTRSTITAVAWAARGLA